ncbi:hypothetical protein CK203_113320 [Vitis vinifera]|uniref:Uncharacterized protein n=1 Tax=Vitis vinifera TaxID=29760 RepID=A0A438CZI2_VITVI|nr:hypothetical protein CK203_113320 [Vitis vinifera]
MMHTVDQDWRRHYKSSLGCSLISISADKVDTQGTVAQSCNSNKWSIPPKLEEVNSELNLTEPDSLEVIAESNSAIDVANAEGTPQLDVKAGEDKATATIAEEWEQLIVNEDLREAGDPKTVEEEALSPIITNSIMADGCALMKKPLIPFQPIHVTAAGRASIASKPMKPNFQRKHG